MKILKSQHLDKSTGKNKDLRRYWGHDKATLEKFHVETRRELKQGDVSLSNLHREIEKQGDTSNPRRHMKF